ncbi:hypothetical protein [Aurantibacillus circumpalustris]|uniref:hypothetical protein n=1 Tax=Aurantibacillus circumpalustris TaxID=3036359 RepID=UPI00295AA6AF|nr:hypothetical protein [Aurantibacillus circumpalustris]
MKKLWCHIKEWKNEAIGIALAVALFLCTPHLLRWIDPTAGAYDAGVLHIIVFSVVAILTFSFLSWVGMQINFGEVFNYVQNGFVKDFKGLTGWQKICAVLLVYFGYLLAFVAMAKAI